MKYLVLSMAVFLGGAAVASAEEIATMTIHGQGEIAVTPDMATLRLGVVTEAETAGAALAANSADLAAVLDTLGTAGIEARNIQTSQLSIHPIWSDHMSSISDGRDRQITGFTATNELSVRVRDLEKLGDVLDAVAAQGANTMRGLSFGLSDPDPVTEEARLAAVADAQARATLLAGAAEVEIVGIHRIEDSTGGMSPAGRAEFGMLARDAVPIAEGEVTVSATVTIIYEIDG
ncbi:SIMPL domain-containing protein [Fontisubflavum oceani]|uniref:SIMPL domain-containing protein n=1 Tax=Fontisubflavum oceani TaxID=2978973 RepID=UPI0025B5A15A|nr:SIMPL domain-containing protein [Fontisubflavum oceani]WJY21428.1 SIMPL domain-containing protein [Fontisubflavum oceani]